jgi:nucleolar protein 56
MKCFIAETYFGIFAFDEAENILNFIDFNEDDKKIVQFFKDLESDTLPIDYTDFILELKNSGFNEFIFDNSKLQTLTSKQMGCSTSVDKSSLEFKNFRLNFVLQLKKCGIHKSKEEILKRFKSISEMLIRYKISLAGERKDKFIIQTIETIDVIKRSLSLFSMRLREWYGLHFPELTDKIIEDDILLAKIVSILGNRNNFTLDKIKKNFIFKDQTIKKLIKKANESMGAIIDISIVQDYSNEILSLNKYKDSLETHLDELMEKLAPNIKAIVGSLIGAKLISKAGSLKKLAFMPASRIQLLGAETALYRFLRTGEKKPKHGLIFQWQQIRGSPANLRGKISRLVAGKIAISAKIDHFGGDFRGDQLSQDIERKIKAIEEKYSNQPLKQDSKKKQKQIKRKYKEIKRG